MSLAHRHDPPNDNELSYPDLPADIAVEQALLGACIVRNELVPQVRVECEAGAFSDPLHQRIAEAIYTLDAEQRPATPLTLRTALHGDRGLEELPAGAEYFEHLADGAPETFTERGRRHVVQLAIDVADLKTRRDAMIAIWEAQDELSKPLRRSVADVLKPVVSASDRAAERAEASRGSTSAMVTALALVRPQSDVTADIIGKPVKSGLTKLDKLTDGFLPGNLTVIGGRTGMGKSTWGTNIARCAAEQGARVEYFSLEMSKPQLVARLLADMDFDRFERDGVKRPLDYSRILKRRWSEPERQRAANMAELLESLDIRIHDRGGMTVGEILAIARASAATCDGPGIVLIDHIHILRPSGNNHRGNRVSELTEISAELKNGAKMTRWPWVALAQLNRGPEKKPEKDRRPELSDLRDSGTIEQDADEVIFLHRPGYYVERRKPTAGPRDPDWNAWKAEYESARYLLDVIVAKNRDGKVDNFSCFTDMGAAAIRDRDPATTAPATDDDDIEGLLPAGGRHG